MTQNTAEEIYQWLRINEIIGPHDAFDKRQFIEALERFQSKPIPLPIPGDLKRWIEEQAKILGKESTAPDKETPNWLETDIKRGMKAMHDLLSPQIEEQRKTAIENLNQRDYWRARCEAAEYLISPDAHTLTPQYSKWLSLKLNSEQEDKRSVATEDDSSNTDGKQAIDFGKFLTLHGYELYNDGWALQKGKRCKTNEQVYEQFKAQNNPTIKIPTK